MGILYLAALALSLTGMVLIDRRWRLFLWRDARRAVITLAVGVVFFLVWDLFGIGLGIFFRGETEFMTGLQLAPELPLEELFFLTLLCYLTMNLYGALTRWLSSRRAGWLSSRRRRRIETADDAGWLSSRLGRRIETADGSRYGASAPTRPAEGSGWLSSRLGRRIETADDAGWLSSRLGRRIETLDGSRYGASAPTRPTAAAVAPTRPTEAGA